MKRFLLLFIIVYILSIFFYVHSDNRHKVFKVVSPIEIFLDYNQNLIFEETKSFNISDIHYIGEKDLNVSQFPFVTQLSNEEKFFASYMAQYYAEHLLNKRFVKIKNNEIFINNNKYSDLILKTKYVFNNTETSQKLFMDNIKNINLDDYVIYNSKSKKYHKINCEQGLNSSKYKIILLSKAKISGKPCKLCFIENEKNNGNIESKIHDLLNSITAHDRASSSILHKYFFREDAAFKFSPVPSAYRQNLSVQSENNSIVPVSNKSCLFDDTLQLNNITIFFQDLNKIFKPSGKCNSKVCRALKNEIDNSKYSIDFAIYGFNNQPEILKSLINAQNRGVKIRWVCDFDKRNGDYYKDNAKLKMYLKNYNTDENYEKINSSAIMHNKFFIFDNQKVWTGSSNITSTDLTEFNANYSILINSPKVAEKYSEEFNQMYNGYFHKDKEKHKSEIISIDKNTKLQVLFSPQDNIINDEIIPLINNSQNYIYIPIFFLTHKGMENALINAHNRGVEIKIINDATNAHTKHTIHRELRKAGIKVKTENYAGKMHMKTIVIDDYITVTGSMNYTKSANNKNDENVVIIYNTDIAKYIKNTFIYLWNKIPAKYEKYDPGAESKESIGSCSDGIDNDFDGKIDTKDESCIQN